MKSDEHEGWMGSPGLTPDRRVRQEGCELRGTRVKRVSRAERSRGRLLTEKGPSVVGWASRPYHEVQWYEWGTRSSNCKGSSDSKRVTKVVLYPSGGIITAEKVGGHSQQPERLWLQGWCLAGGHLRRAMKRLSRPGVRTRQLHVVGVYRYLTGLSPYETRSRGCNHSRPT